MNKDQFSIEFDVAYNNITSNASPPLNGLEKSMFLTKAQNELLLVYYNGLNGRYTSFEATEESRRYLDSLVVSNAELTLKSTESIEGYKLYIFNKPKETHSVIDSLGNAITIDTDSLLFIVRDSAIKQTNGKCAGKEFLSIKPVSHDGLTHILRDPFKCPTKDKAIRIDLSDGIGIVTKEDLTKYLCTYIRIPKPIILEDISGYGFNIEGFQAPQDPVCELPDIMHQKIIDRAVLLAKAAYVGDLSHQAALSTQTL